MARSTPQKITMIPVEELSASIVQPRSRFDDRKIAELAQSIAAHGILQPLIIRKGVGTKYEIVAGERRFRAAKQISLKQVPCIFMDIENERALSVALVENIQREDLNPIEEAAAYFRLKEFLGLSQEEVAQRVGKDRASVANTIRLLRLPKSVQDLVVNEDISMGHARALLALDSVDMMVMLAKKIVREGLSVRKTEGLIRSIKSGYLPSELRKLSEADQDRDPLRKEIQQKLEHAFGTRVVLRRENNGYAMVVHFADAGQLNGLLDVLGVDI